jgi:O-methyltransferase
MVPDASAARPEQLYLDLLKGCLTRTLFPDRSILDGLAPNVTEFNAAVRLDGRDWPTEGETMIGTIRLNNVQQCAVDALQNGIPGDFVEAGVWRGGAAILMRAVLAAYGDRTRRVWLADSFNGLPRPDPERYPHDTNDRYWESPLLRIPLDEVKRNFARYGLLDDRVRFLPGWFKDSLPTAPIDTIAVLRLDADMYESTIQALTSLYPKLAPGGYVIIDDYNALHNCKAAVHDFRDMFGIQDEIHSIDWSGVYWQKVSRRLDIGAHGGIPTQSVKRLKSATAKPSRFRSALGKIYRTIIE